LDRRSLLLYLGSWEKKFLKGIGVKMDVSGVYIEASTCRKDAERRFKEKKGAFERKVLFSFFYCFVGFGFGCRVFVVW